MMPKDIYFFDSEVFRHDTLFVFKRQSDGAVEAFWNDPESVQDFVRLLDPVLCGFNARDYDAHILKATLLGWTPEEIHHVSDTIIHYDDRSMVWSLFQGYPWVNLPPIIDLFHDVVPRKGLKDIEANIGMAVVESSVDFDIDRPLTAEEREEVLHYCLHDVDATEQLYDLRYDYLSAKAMLCEMRDVDPLTMLKHTNARVVSEVLDAQKLSHPHDKEDAYHIPANLDPSAIPAEVLLFAESFHGYNCEADIEPIEFMFHGCPTIVGLGGIHAAVPKYKETATGERAILIQDIGSYYPSLIINNGYMSRAVPDAEVYKQFYDMRMEAKARGDKQTAEAAKLVLNTTFGTMKDGYNKMYDPMQATRVCLSGQLYIIDLIEQMFRNCPGEGRLQLIQLNTDGWVISCPKSDTPLILEAVARWQGRTGFKVDTDFVESIVQANVNNYVLRTTDGKIKTKGGVVARYEGRGDPNWWKSNSCTIVDKAVVDYLLDGTPIAQTVSECDDIERFQIVAKAGRTFQKVVHQRLNYIGEQLRIGRSKDERIETVEETPVQRVNRLYATTDVTYGGIFKVKMQDELGQEVEYGEEVSRQRIPLTPEHCFIDNENVWKGQRIDLTPLDKSWYVSLAKRKAHEFITRDKKEREQMAETTESTNELQQPAEETATEEKPKPTRRKKTEEKADEGGPNPGPLPFRVRLLELQKAMSGIASKVKFDGVVSNISYEYADTQQYKAMLSQACSMLDLLFGIDLTCDFKGVITPESKTTPTYGAQADGSVFISDVHSDEFESYAISGFGANVQPGYCNGAAQTNALRNFILNNYLLDNKGREGDDQAFNAGEGGGNGKGYVTPDAKAAVKQGIKDEKAEEAQYATDLFARALFDKIGEVRQLDGMGTKFSKLLGEHFNEDGTPKLRADGKSTLPKTEAVKALTKAEEYIAKAAAAAQGEAA